MDYFGLIVHLAAGMAGGQTAGRMLWGADSAAGRILAGAAGGLLGGQVVERSMALTSAPLAPATFDPGAAIAGAGGACIGGIVLAAAITCLARCFERE